MKWNAFINLFKSIYVSTFYDRFCANIFRHCALCIMPGSLLIADTVDVHSFSVWDEGIPLVGRGGVSERWLECVCTAKAMLCFKASEGRLKYFFQFMNEVKKTMQELELCPKDTDAPTDNIYMVYSEKINKGS
jgi:hypothetical protein